MPGKPSAGRRALRQRVERMTGACDRFEAGLDMLLTAVEGRGLPAEEAARVTIVRAHNLRCALIALERTL